MPRLLVLSMLVAVACGSSEGSGDGACARESWCEGDRLMLCVAHCQYFKCQHTTSVSQDCAKLGDEVGVKKTCGELNAGNDSTVLACRDVERVACSLAPSGANTSCAPNGSLRVCLDTPDGLVVDTQRSPCTAPQKCTDVATGGVRCE